MKQELLQDAKMLTRGIESILLSMEQKDNFESAQAMSYLYSKLKERMIKLQRISETLNPYKPYEKVNL
jgi:hypothetical protein